MSAGSDPAPATPAPMLAARPSIGSSPRGGSGRSFDQGPVQSSSPDLFAYPPDHRAVTPPGNHAATLAATRSSYDFPAAGSQTFAPESKDHRRFIRNLVPSFFTRKRSGGEKGRNDSRGGSPLGSDRLRPSVSDLTGLKPGHSGVLITSLDQLEPYPPRKSSVSPLRTTPSRRREASAGSDQPDVEYIRFRVYRRNGTFATLATPITATTQFITDLLARRFFIEDPARCRFMLEQRMVERTLKPHEQPLLLQRRLLHMAGYNDIQAIDAHGRETTSYLCRFIFDRPLPEPDMLDGLASVQYVDLRGRNLTRIPASLAAPAAAYCIQSLDLSENVDLVLPPEFLQACTALKELRLSGTELTAVPEAIAFATGLEHLDLSNNRIRQVDALTLTLLPRLKSLSLKGNRLQTLPEDMVFTSRINTLDLSSNQLTDIPLPVAGMVHLIDLDLSFNRIQDVLNVRALTQLERLVLLGNELRQLPESFTRLARLIELDLRENQLVDISPVAYLPRLQALHVDHNQLSSVHGCAAALHLSLARNPLTTFAPRVPSTMTVLNLTRAKLTALPADMAQVSGLERIVLDHNQLSQLALDWPRLTHLRELRVACNCLQTLPDGLAQCPKLELIDVHANNLRQLPTDLWSCGALTVLNISSNLLATVTPPPAGAGSHTMPLSRCLHYLLAADNRLTDTALVSLMYLPELRVVNLACNRLLELPDEFFLHCAKIEQLILSGNQVAALPDTVGALKQLRILALSNNKLVSVPAEVGKLGRLMAFDVGNNNLKFNVSNWPYDWNWNWNRELRFLGLSGNRRLEIKALTTDPTTAAAQQRDLASFDALTKLRVLGLMDVTLRSDVPAETPHRRVRTAISEVGFVSYGIADVITADPQPLVCRDLAVARARGFHDQDEYLFALFDSTSGASELLVKHLTDRFYPALAEDLVRAQDVGVALRTTFLRLNHEFGANVAPGSSSGTGTMSGSGAASSPSSASTGMLPASATDTGSPQSATTLVDPTAKLRQAYVGCNGVVAYLLGLKLYIANVGTSAAIVCRGGQASVVSTLHTAMNPRERYRVLGQMADTAAAADAAQGGAMWLDKDGKVQGSVEATRQFGCYALMPLVNALPSLYEMDIGDNDEFMILLTRSVLDRVAPQTAVDIVRQHMADPMLAAERLRDIASGYATPNTSVADAAPPGGGAIVVIALRSLYRKTTRRTMTMSRTFARRALGVTSRGAQATRRYIPPIPVDPPSEILDRTLMRLEREVDPPTGHVALVFTDIKGSTRLWETRPAAMQAAIKQHNALFRRLLRTVGRGYEVKTEGDAFMVAFPTVFHAAQWCLTVQEQLMLVDWPRELLEAPEAAEVKVPRAVVDEEEEEDAAAAGMLPAHGSAPNLAYYSEDRLAPQTQGGAADADELVIFRGIRVRMGIHCGQPSCERDPITGRMDYFGRMVNRSARISSSADGGEITISADVLNELEEYGVIGLDGMCAPPSGGVSDLGVPDDGAFPGPGGSDRDSDVSSASAASPPALDPAKVEAAQQLRRLGMDILKVGEVSLKGLENPETLWVVFPRSLRARFPYLRGAVAVDEKVVTSPEAVSASVTGSEASPVSQRGLDGPGSPQVAPSDVCLPTGSPMIDLVPLEPEPPIVDQVRHLLILVHRLEAAVAGHPVAPGDRLDWLGTSQIMLATYPHFLASLVQRLENVVASLHMQELAHHHQPLLQSLISMVHTNPHYVAQALELVSLRWSQAPAPASATWAYLPPPLMPPRPDQ
ncbi:cysteinyl-tRNA synthetase [Allomyces javanicus]|nr:cysteinyl-tRNA synthetase [Allomyces javanicus]